MKKQILTLSLLLLALSMIFAGCGNKDDNSSEPSTTSFQEKASYYDELAKGDIAVEIETTAADKYYEFVGDKNLLPPGVFDKLNYIVANYYERIYSKYGESFSRPKITINIVAGYVKDDVNYTVDDSIYLNPNWFADHPDDYDSILCAIMGTMQAYKSQAPDWLKSSICDYVRAEFSTMYADKTWSLPGSYEGKSYEEGGIYGAAFLKWINSQVETDLVYRLNKALQNGTYDESFWKTETGFTFGQLWSQYQGK